MQDLGGAVDKLKGMLSSEDGQAQLQNLLGAFMSDSSEESSSEYTDSGVSGSPSGMPDMDMLLKMQKMMSSVNGGAGLSGGHSSFLQALKPYLSDSRRGKVDSAAKILQFTKMAALMKDLNSDN